MPARQLSRVFVSHSSADAAAATRVGEALEAAKFDEKLAARKVRLASRIAD